MVNNSCLIKAADVVDCVLRVYVEAAVGGHRKPHAGGVGFCTRAARHVDRASAASDLHELRAVDVKGELTARHDDTNGLACAVREQNGVRHALAVEEDVGLFDDADVVELGHELFSVCVYVWVSWALMLVEVM